MIIAETATPYDNQTICGERLIPADKDSAHAVYLRHGRACGVTYECGRTRPYLRFNPGYQLPPYARDKKGWKRFVWECEDERAINMNADDRDGEIVYICDDDDVNENLEEKIESGLEFLLGDTFYGELCEYVSSLIDR
ncbi:MAG: hypothetical protein IKG18_08175 [Atopobiaceae bacterium]|nr:hypothetical protein [Atopobiaceae bacterium]